MEPKILVSKVPVESVQVLTYLKLIIEIAYLSGWERGLCGVAKSMEPACCVWARSLQRRSLLIRSRFRNSW